MPQDCLIPAQRGGSHLSLEALAKWEQKKIHVRLSAFGGNGKMSFISNPKLMH